METIVIIGAGASGLACMNELLKENKYNIIILEQAKKAARKVLASGNGRCNVSNLNMDIKYYNHQDPFIEKLIKEFDIIDFFKQLSLKLRFEKNLVYPYSLSSLSVKNALMKNIDQVSYIDECEVLSIKNNKSYEIITTNGHYQADKIVIATGSPASHLSGQNNLKMLEKMNVYDTANKLAEEIKLSEEYVNFKKSKTELENNIELKSKIKEFEQKRQQMQMLTIQGIDPTQEKAQEIQNMYTELLKDEKAKEYFETEMKFSVLIADVNKIIGDAIKDVLK